MLPLTIHCVSIVILVVSLLVFLHLTKHERTKPLLFILIFLSMASFWVYTDFFRFHALFPTKTEYTEQYKKGSSRLSFVHWHEMLHYYLGAKYFRELGYDGLYEAIVLADVESGKPVVTRSAVKNLRDNPRLIKRKDAADRAREEYKPRFTEARWQEFVGDVEYMKSIASLPEWLDKALFDAGYNPPPTWALFGVTVANLVPIAEPWFDYGAKYDQVGLLPWIDFIMLFTAFFFIARSFGLNNLFVFFIIFGTSFIINYAYNIGSLFRYTWFFGLVMGICMLKQERYRLAGAFLALAAVDRMFPIFFVAGAFMVLAWRYYDDREKGYKPLRDFCVSGLAVGVGMITLSVAVFGWHSWVEFYDKIVQHSHIRFTNHLGYFSIATMESWVPNQNFWGEEGARRFFAWNNQLNENWDAMKWGHIPFMVATLLCAAWCARYIPAYESLLLTGTLLLFFCTFTVIYYYSFLALIPMMLYRQPFKSPNILIFTAFFLSFIALRMIPWFTPDELVQNYYISYTIYIFLVFWLAVRFVEHKGWQKKKKPAAVEAA